MYLFLSPHFDDAVLSCGATLHQLAASGTPVMVRTVMGGKPSANRIADTPLTRELHARWASGDDPIQIRALEDETAVKSLGAQADRLLNWTDCIYRVSSAGKPLYTTNESLFGEVHPDDRAARLIPTLVLPSHPMVRVLYAPLGIGNHVDHQIVRNWALELRKQYHWLALKFYEEYPYSEDKQAISRASEFFAAYSSPIPLKLETVALSEADVNAKVAAIRHYRSQISTFWANEAEMETAVQAALVRGEQGEPVERYWSTE
jgi:LmbE family N-acetylglucosaminyl deacetylase